MRSYSQLNAMLAITRGSLKAIFRSPSAVIFSFIFPFIFILVFGFIGDSGGRRSFKIALEDGCDTSNALYSAIRSTPGIMVLKYGTIDSLNLELQKGRLTAVLAITKNTSSNAPYRVSFRSSSASNDKWPQFKNLIDSKINEVSNATFANRPAYAFLDFKPDRDIPVMREYKTIDFILPGQLGFSLLSSGVFGVAFMFFSLRNTLVLKRFFATPINRSYIVLGEALSRVIFQMLTAIVIILAGRFLFGFTLIHGVTTFLEMLLLSFIGLIVFMGFGFIVSGIAKTDSTIPPFANLITLPQFLLGGTFFSADAFPRWLQPISKALPLTHLNTAMRRVAFEGQSIWDVRGEILVLVIWGIVVYAVAIKVFRWE